LKRSSVNPPTEKLDGNNFNLNFNGHNNGTPDAPKIESPSRWVNEPKTSIAHIFEGATGMT
jgi:hypothetical protein